MAYRRSLSARATIVARKFHPSVSHLLHDDDRNQSSPISLKNVNNYVQNRRFSNGVGKFGFGLSGHRGFSKAMASPSSFAGFECCRYMSTSIGEDSDKFGLISDVAEVLSDSAVQVTASHAPVLDEVAIAAADSFLPVKMLQYLIDAVHTYAGLNW